MLLHKNSTLFKQLGIALLMMSLTRFVFLFANFNAFNDLVLTDFLAGIWIDAITIGMYFIPFYFLFLLPVPFFNAKVYQLVLKIVFHITNSTIIALNLIDVEYYKFTAKRSTSDLFSTLTQDNDFDQLFFAFLKDFWWLIAICIALIILSNWLYNQSIRGLKSPTNYYYNTLNFFLVFALLFIMGRGGISYRPADMLTASRLTKPQKIGLVTNTPLSIIKTIGKPPLEEKHYFKEDSPKIYSSIHKGNTEHKIAGKPNIMVIILESFGNEWLGKKSGENFTPFLDSLLDHSLYFTNAFANGKKSIEAIPSIFAGIPSLMDNPYVSSVYGTNNIKALPEMLGEMEYSSGFYHGATNGSMKFDVFTTFMGFDKYMGRTEFNNEDQCDDTWGALDEYFLPWTAKSITKTLKEPFLAGLFTLSSHHPYYIPPKHIEHLPNGSFPIAKSIAYTDMSLRLFFLEAQKQPWYDNTIFVIAADHTPAGTTAYFQHRIGMYEIPIAIYDPKGRVKPKVEEKLFNHIDIMPTLLDLVGYPKDVYSLGNSYFSKQTPFSVNYIEKSYLYFSDDYLINSIDNNVTGFYNYKLDSLMLKDSSQYYPKVKEEMELKLKGFIQRYNHDLIYNEMIVK